MATRYEWPVETKMRRERLQAVWAEQDKRDQAFREAYREARNSGATNDDAIAAALAAI